MKKLIFIFILVLFFASCNKGSNLDDAECDVYIYANTITNDGDTLYGGEFTYSIIVNDNEILNGENYIIDNKKFNISADDIVVINGNSKELNCIISISLSCNGENKSVKGDNKASLTYIYE